MHDANMEKLFLSVTETKHIIQYNTKIKFCIVMPTEFTYSGKNVEFLSDVIKLRKVTVIFIMSACLSVRMEQLGSH
jgi:CTP-dependent riboflavin kinase